MKTILRKLKWFLGRKDKVSILMVKIPLTKYMSDEIFLKLMYKNIFKRKLDLECPKTFNEKLQWLKLYNRKPEYTDMVDKYKAKKYVADRIGEEYIIPTLGVWECAEDIDFDELPDQFVLKTTHDCGGMVICTDKSKLDIDKARKKLDGCLKKAYYHKNREWPYKNVNAKIIAEKYMRDTKTCELRDYKFFAFDGEAKIMFVASDRQKENEETKFDFFDMDYNHLSFTNGHPNAETLPEKPEKFEQMKELAGKLSKGIPHIRVDFYEVDGNIYFGELTFFHWSGFEPFKPETWDYEIGKYIKLPVKNEERK